MIYRSAANIVQKWSRLVFRKSTDYKRAGADDDDSEDDQSYGGSRKQPRDVRPPPPPVLSGHVSSLLPY